MIPLEKFLQDYDIKKAKDLEHKDPQFLALQNCRNNIKNKNKNENLFVYLVMQCALVSYQIAWSGELWRTEFWKKVEKDRNVLLNMWEKNENNSDWRLDFLKSSKNNKRIYNIKKSRLDKLNNILKTEKDFLKYRNNLKKLNEILAKTMNTTVYSKTIVFAIKMFGYAYTIINWNDIDYPMSINIPVDSRLKKIYSLNVDKKTTNEIEICEFFNKLSQKYSIPPLDLDTILRLDYRKTIK